ncbi:hypothetical protein [Shewanella sp.]|uniref:hypothetical protein n=1 Tax=Shewanella sp. TaxID=50422 RepID=UPI003567299C
MSHQPFHITRLHTQAGIFRLSGEMNSIAPISIRYTVADFMSTDGWRALDLASDAAKTVLAQITPEVLCHLGVTQQPV